MVAALRPCAAAQSVGSGEASKGGASELPAGTATGAKLAAGPTSAATQSPAALPEKSAYCLAPGCVNNAGKRRRASYGREPGKPLYCSKHGVPLQLRDVVHRCCPVCWANDRVISRATWGEDGMEEATPADAASGRLQQSGEVFVDNLPTGPTHCPRHGRELGLRCLVGPFCCICAEGEVRQEVKASYGARLGEPPTHCATHGRAVGLVDVVHRHCEVCAQAGLTARATFGVPQRRMPITHCAKHGKPLGLVKRG